LLGLGRFRCGDNSRSGGGKALLLFALRLLLLALGFFLDRCLALRYIPLVLSGRLYPCLLLSALIFLCCGRGLLLCSLCSFCGLCEPYTFDFGCYGA
jgi:hypothetical protein